MKKLFFFYLLCGCFVSCQTTKHSYVECREQGQTTYGSSGQRRAFAIDSVVQSLIIDADSISVYYQLPPVTMAGSESPSDSSQRNCLESTGDSPLSPILRVTAHRPHIVAQKKSESLTASTETVNDSIKSVNTTQASASSDKESIGVAKPANTVSIIITCALLGVGALILLLYLHKKGII